MGRTTSTDNHGNVDTLSADAPVILQIDGDSVSLPDAAFVKDSDIVRDGQDLVLEAADGSAVVIEGYFSAMPPPLLQAPGGETLTPALVESFVRGSGPQQYAQRGTLDDESPIGSITEINGEAKIIRTDGSIEPVTLGTSVYEGDVVETAANGAVNIVFADETSFAVSQNAKLAIDEFVYDPATESGSQNFSILSGLFVFTSGLIGRDDPDDVNIDTPIGSIGIRGTVIVGNVDTGEITLKEGAIVLRTFDGQELTLAGQFETGRFNTNGGGIDYMGTKSAADFAQTFDSLKAVTPNLFSGISESGAQDSQSNEGNNNASDPSGASDNSQSDSSESDAQNDSGADAQEGAQGEGAQGEASPADAEATTQSNTDSSADAFGEGADAFADGAPSNNNNGTQNSNSNPAGSGSGSGAQANAGAPPSATGASSNPANNAQTLPLQPASPSQPPPAVNAAPSASDVGNVGADLLNSGGREQLFSNGSVLQFNAGSLFTDLEGQTMTFTSSNALPSTTLTVDPSTGMVNFIIGDSFLAAGDADTSIDITVTATDSAGASGTALFTVLALAPTIAGTVSATNNDVIGGAASNDTIIIGHNDVTAFGGSGGDTFEFSIAGGNNALYGGSGIDFVNFTGLGLSGANGVTLTLAAPGEAGAATYESSGTITNVLWGIENITGSGADDGITGNALNNVLNGAGGNDTIYGGDGNDNIDGGTGNDTLYGEAGDDLINGGAGNDLIYGDGGADTLSGGADNDTFFASVNDGNDTIDGGTGANEYNANALSSDVSVDIGSGNISYAGSTDTVTNIQTVVTGSGNDTFIAFDIDSQTYDGGSGTDLYDASALANNMFVTLDAAGAGTVDTGTDIDNVSNIETFLTGTGDDQFIIANGGPSYTLNGGGGMDRIDLSNTTASIDINLNITSSQNIGGSIGVQTLLNIEDVIGSMHNDIIRGNASANNLQGGAGDDILEGGAGADTLDGGAGDDTADYSASTAGIDLNFNTNVNTGGDAQGDTLIAIENIIGSSHNDVMTILNTNITFDGGGGNDFLALSGANTFTFAGSGFTNIQTLDAAIDGTQQDIVIDNTSSLLSDDLTINLDANDTIDIDFTGLGFTLTSGSFDTSINGSAIFENGTNTITVNYNGGALANRLTQTGVETGLNLNTISSTDGITISGVSADSFATEIAAFGDRNGDGFDDIAFLRGDNEQSDGTVYFMDGSATLVDITTSALITNIGVLSTTLTGGPDNMIIAAGGDFNNDGFMDYIVGDSLSDSSVTSSGQIEIISGQTGNVLADLTGLDMGDLTGASVSFIGDINGDGLDDVAIGAPGADEGSTDEGAVAVLYGTTSTGTIDVTTLAGSAQGDIFTAGTTNSLTGQNIQSIGDFNDDGFDDFVISSPNTGEVHIVYGNEAGSTTTADSQLISGLGVTTDLPLLDLGDISGDGISDIAVASSNEIHVFFGNGLYDASAAALTAGTDDITIQAAAGFEIIGGAATGDFNGDGFDDISVAMRNISGVGTEVNNYTIFGGSGAGVYSNEGGVGIDIDITSDMNAFQMNYTLDNTTDDITLAAGGDVNGDGFDDLVIGASNANSNQGEAIIVYGRESGGEPYQVGTNESATQDNISLVGTIGNDTLSDNTQTGVSMSGGAGDDTIIINNDLFQNLNGGGGSDTLEIEGADQLIDFTNVGSESFENIENINMMAVDSQTVVLGMNELFDMMKNSPDGRATIEGSADDIFVIEASFLDGTNGWSGALDTNNVANAEEGYFAALTGRNSETGGFSSYDFGATYELWISDDMLNSGNIIIAENVVTGASSASSMDETLIGTTAADTLSDATWNNVSMFGFGGDDIFTISGNNQGVFDGGAGNDAMNISGAFDFANAIVTDIEAFDVTGDLTLSISDIVALASGNNTGNLIITGTGSLTIDNETGTDATAETNVANLETLLGAASSNVTGGLTEFDLGGTLVSIDNNLISSGNIDII